MLLELKVKNFAIIDHVEIQFGEGLNILSGETGAGKSVLLKSLALLMGEKALADTVRTGAEAATIEGFFDLTKRQDVRSHLTGLGIDADEERLAVRRVISAQGKSRVYLNGSLASLSTLREVVAPLIEVTGQSAPLIEMTLQHDNRHLLTKSYHLDILDDYTGSWSLRHEYQQIFATLRARQDEIRQIQEDSRTRAQRLDFLHFQRDEITGVSPTPGEDETLAAQIQRLRNATRISDFIQQTESALYGDDDSALVRLHQIMQRAAEFSHLDPALYDRLQGLQQAKTLIEECVYDLRTFTKDLDAGPEELSQLEERLSQIRKLQKKYGSTVEEILATLPRIETEIAQLEFSDDRLKEIFQEKAQLEEQIRARSEELHHRRLNGSKLLAKSVNQELQDLNMKGVSFTVEVTTLETPSPTGISEVEFMIRASKQDPPRSLARFASGGELSRILLALKCVAGAGQHPRSYLFDEVDAGVSGPTAEKVGRKLKAIAQGQQVICVTHLPQVASCADHHFLIRKVTSSNKGTQMEVRRLTKEQKIEEIARLISGEKITKTSREHARELLSSPN